MALALPRSGVRHDTAEPASAIPALLAVSLLLLVVRLYATAQIGFGDSEALYAAYAAHPQPAYLDHPGMIGVVARAIGGGRPPSPWQAHIVTALLATAFPWLMFVACRACGAPRERAAAAALVVALVPEMAIGLFALTPDLLLALCWTAVLALVAAGLRAPPRGPVAAACFAAAGVLTGVAAASKITGVLLAAALVLTYTSRPARAHARTFAPWLGLAAGALVFAPVALFEARTGWPMLRHRFVDTQGAAGLSLRNAGALFFGQLAYLSPVTAGVAYGAARSLWRAGRPELDCTAKPRSLPWQRSPISEPGPARTGDPVTTWLRLAAFVPGTLLVALCLWSRVAEPHWLAPAFLALAPAAARAPAAQGPRGLSRRWIRAACATGFALIAAVHAWVLVPAALQLAPAATYDPRLDIANELYGWPNVTSAVRAELRHMPPDAVVAAPHWVLCAQLAAALHGEADVGCNTPVEDDFDRWLPRAQWRARDALVWVTDARFPFPPPGVERVLLHSTGVRIEREGRIVRTFTIAVYAREASAMR
ncbi:MAG TPA: glycosyltransferase family 39 protein [Polyangiaceae bacterium]|nr:glycosyltransferase family 39 protein [Polyangiaceae bacterium]